MDVGVIVKYGKLVAGRETQAIELFAETRTFLEEKRKEGFISYFEPFFYETGDLEAELGFWIIKGERDKVWKLMQDEDYRWLLTRAGFLVDHLDIGWLTVGEGIPKQVELSSKALVEYEPV